MTTEITIGKADINDTLRLSLLFKQVYLHTYATEGITHEFTNFITKRFSPPALEQIIDNNPDSLIVAYYNDNPIGVAEIIYNKACPIENILAPELSKLYVLEAFCGKGVGHALLGEAERMVAGKGATQLWLEVYTKNPRAIAFYERQQYQCIGHTLFPMETNTYENKVMCKQLSGSKYHYH